MTECPVKLVRSGAVASLTLSQPDTRNALSGEIKAALEVHVPELVDDHEVRCIVITGSGTAFCAGGDIRSMTGQQDMASVRRRMAKSYGWIETLLEGETPIVTAVNGPAIGAGFGLAMLGDIIVGAENAWFMGGFQAIGVVADYGLARTLPRAVGSVRAKDIILTGRKVSAEEAARIGMITRVVPSDALQEEAHAVAQSLAAGPTIALGLTKSLINQAFDGDAAGYLRKEGFSQSCAFGTQDHKRAVESFLAKRQPNFEGY